ncbi:hypothetical protein H310_13099 [Aphanomyces invadans]|uniref:Uncharacterized protein n=1 Tax=Aphanomyces invadans TaxID=157072 RepID=A0A024TER6_9STRA|nr:hypothetical protein H310_13099 [Aphanomyces invadans]ETV92655.1 hypothetical protein H310_13099 [Aphanomyces invadans]|eukprot:XP_008878691.1 hypothetical protein H310_13099 [Aphanomyces invadans]
MSGIRAAVVGDIGVGKSSLVRALGGEIVCRDDGTGVVYQVAAATGRPICVAECASLAHCTTLAPQVVLLAFDLSQPSTFATAIAKWAAFRGVPEATVVLVGCKRDLMTDVLVSATARDFAATEFDGYFEISASGSSADVASLRSVLFSPFTSALLPPPPPLHTTSTKDNVSSASSHALLRDHIVVNKTARDIWLFDKRAFAQQSRNFDATSASKGRVFSTALALAKRRDAAAIERGHAMASRLAVRGRRAAVEAVTERSTTPTKSIRLTNSDGSPRTYSFMHATQASTHRADARTRKSNIENVDDERVKSNAPWEPTRRRRSCRRRSSPLAGDIAACHAKDASTCAAETTRTRPCEARPSTKQVDVDNTGDDGCCKHLNDSMRPASPRTIELQNDVAASEITVVPPPLPVDESGNYCFIQGGSDRNSSTPGSDTPPRNDDAAITFDDDDVLGALESFHLSI